MGLPWRLGDAVELYPEVGWHQTLYQTDAQGFEERGVFTGRVDLRTRLRRRFGERLIHLVEPRVGYAVVTGETQSDNPLFVPRTAVPQRRIRQLELENVVIEEVKTLWEECIEIVAGIVSQGIERGEFSDCDPWEVANILWTVANGLIQTEKSATRRSLRRASLEKAFDDAIELFLRGLAA